MEFQRKLNTEHVLIDASTAPLLARMRAALAAALVRPIEDGDPELIAAASLLPFFAQGLASADIASKSMLLQFAVGKDLDTAAAQYGLSRFEPSAAQVMIVISRPDDTYTGSMTLSVTAKTSSGLEFSFYDPYFVWYGVDAFINLACNTPGEIGNGVNSFSIDDVAIETTPDQYQVFSSVYSPSTGGRDRESDDDFARRTNGWLLQINPAGSAAAYREIALDYPGVIDARADITPPGYLSGQVLIIYLAPDGASNLGNFVLNHYRRLVGDYVTVLPAQPWDNAPTFYWFAPSAVNVTALQEAVDEASKRYLAWQCNRIGRGFDPSVAIKMLVAAGAVQVTCSFAPSSIAYNEYIEPGTIMFDYQGVATWS